MKVFRSSLFRALCAIVIGVLLILYREQTVTWITIAIGVLFFLSGVISVVSYYSAKHHAQETEVYDAEGRLIAGGKPVFPIVGIGSLFLGIILALMPNTFITWLMYILAAVLILGAINQYMNLATVAKGGHVGLVFWLLPSIILMIGIVAIVHPAAIASAPLFIIGWSMLFYGVVECVDAIKINHERKRNVPQQPAPQPAEAIEAPQEEAQEPEQNP